MIASNHLCGKQLTTENGKEREKKHEIRRNMRRGNALQIEWNLVILLHSKCSYDKNNEKKIYSMKMLTETNLKYARCMFSVVYIKIYIIYLVLTYVIVSKNTLKYLKSIINCKHLFRLNTIHRNISLL